MSSSLFGKEFTTHSIRQFCSPLGCQVRGWWQLYQKSRQMVRAMMSISDLLNCLYCLNDKLMQCLVVFQHDLHGQYLPQGKEKLLLKDIPCLKKSCLWSLPLYPDWIRQNKYSHRMCCNISVTYGQKVTTLISQVQLLLIAYWYSFSCLMSVATVRPYATEL